MSNDDEKLIEMHNAYYSGSGETVIDYLRKAYDLGRSLTTECAHTNTHEIYGGSNHGEASTKHLWCRDCGAVAFDCEYGLNKVYNKGWTLPAATRAKVVVDVETNLETDDLEKLIGGE